MDAGGAAQAESSSEVFELVCGARRAAVSRQRLLRESGYFRALFQHDWSDSATATSHELHGLPEVPAALAAH